MKVERQKEESIKFKPIAMAITFQSQKEIEEVQENISNLLSIAEDEDDREFLLELKPATKKMFSALKDRLVVIPK